MTTAATAATFTLTRVQELLGLSKTTVAGLIAAGFVSPVRGARNEHRFTFQDLMLLRTAHALQKANIPPRKILRSLVKLKAELPAELPLTGLRITAVGADVAVRDPSGRLQAETGQLLMDFEVRNTHGSVAFLQAPNKPDQSAADWFMRGALLEETDAAGAEAAYRRAIELEPSRAAPYLNLGAMLCEAGRSTEAVSLYREAAQLVENEPLVHFNLAIALEDAGQPAEALASYDRAIGADSALADAHYNAGVLLEKLGDKVAALRHFSTYRRLQRNESP